MIKVIGIAFGLMALTVAGGVSLSLSHDWLSPQTVSAPLALSEVAPRPLPPERSLVAVQPSGPAQIAELSAPVTSLALAEPVPVAVATERRPTTAPGVAAVTHYTLSSQGYDDSAILPAAPALTAQGSTPAAQTPRPASTQNRREAAAPRRVPAPFQLADDAAPPRYIVSPFPSYMIGVYR